ncbi:MAG: phosphatase PAP2 family protein [Candidatus Pacebacteria bacterium]|nr:phosphatase PAP2 family protein [Candidatus Paceibacterota bacterium]
MNNDIFFFFNNFSNQSGSLDLVIIFLAVYLPYLVVLGAGIYLLMHHEISFNKDSVLRFRQKWSEIFTAFLAGGVAWIVGAIIKNIIAEPRPFISLTEVVNLFPETGFAFPSQHAAFFTALAFSIYLQHKKAGYFFLFFALFISIARIAGGVHYPIDILGGIILGILVAYIIHHLRFAKEVKNV